MKKIENTDFFISVRYQTNWKQVKIYDFLLSTNAYFVSRQITITTGRTTNHSILCSEAMLSSLEKILTSTVLESRIRISIKWSWCFAYLWFCGLHVFIFGSLLSFISLFFACRLRFDTIALFRWIRFR